MWAHFSLPKEDYDALWRGFSRAASKTEIFSAFLLSRKLISSVKRGGVLICIDSHPINLSCRVHRKSLER